MSINNLEVISKSDDFFSVRSNLSDNSQSFESINNKSDIGDDDQSKNILLRIGYLQDKRYDATYNISQVKQRIVNIEKQELELMKESTIQHSQLQDHYISCKDEDDYTKNLAKEAAQRLGCMKYELKILNEQVRAEEQKAEELEEQLEKITERMETSEGEERINICHQRTIVEEKRDQQAKFFEDLEFKELETQSRFEEESEILKRNIIEAQRKFIMSSRDRENRKFVLDEQQIKLMKDTRKALDQLESERNYYNQQLAHYQSIVSACNLKIEELNRRLDGSEYMSFTEQTLPLVEHNGSKMSDDCVYTHLSECSSSFIADKRNATSLISSSSYTSKTKTPHNESLHDKLESLTEIVRLNLSMKSNCNTNKFQSAYTSQMTVNSFDLYQNQPTDSYPSTFSLSDDSSSLAKTDSAICLQHSYKPTVTFEDISIADSESSNQSQIPKNQTMYSTIDLNSDLSNNDENCRPGTKSIIVTRMKEKGHIKKNKQSRPLTCFLPKMHSDFNLRLHIESCGHDLTVCDDHVQIDMNTCQGFLWKLSNRLFSVYRKRWFEFDQHKRELRYYTSKSKSKLKGTICFQSISDVFVDHTHRFKSPQKLSFCIETPTKTYYLVTARLELVTLWVDVIFTGAEAYLTLHPSIMTTSILSQSAE